ncbi:retrovirus-related pol polyprotein from transposon TNT 1-94 [Tanacetum coccineum]
MAFISKTFNNPYKLINNNLISSSNTKYQNVDNSLRIDRRTRDNRQTGQNDNQNQRAVVVTGNRDTVENQVVQQTGIECYNCKRFGHTAKECISAKRVNDSSYHKDKMLMCKQEEAGIQEVIPVAEEATGPVFDKESLEHVHDNDEYNVFAMEKVHPEQPESINDTYMVEQGDSNTTHDSSYMSNIEREVD